MALKQNLDLVTYRFFIIIIILMHFEDTKIGEIDNVVCIEQKRNS